MSKIFKASKKKDKSAETLSEEMLAEMIGASECDEVVGKFFHSLIENGCPPDAILRSVIRLANGGLK